MNEFLEDSMHVFQWYRNEKITLGNLWRYPPQLYQVHTEQCLKDTEERERKWGELACYPICECHMNDVDSYEVESVIIPFDVMIVGFSAASQTRIPSIAEFRILVDNQEAKSIVMNEAIHHVFDFKIDMPNRHSKLFVPAHSEMKIRAIGSIDHPIGQVFMRKVING